MKIPIYCEHCGKLIATFDTAADTSPSCSALFRRVFHGTIPKEWIKKAEEMPHGAGA